MAYHHAIRTTLLTAAAAVLLAGNAATQAPHMRHAVATPIVDLDADMGMTDSDLGSAERIDDTELADQRGGFALAGMTITFGAEIRTYLDGELALLSRVNWADGPQATTEILASGVTRAEADQIVGGVLTTGNIAMRVGDQEVFLANDGQTAIVHRTDGALQNVLINTANHTSLTQQVDATLDLGGYEGFASDIAADRLDFAIGDLIDGSQMDALGN